MTPGRRVVAGMAIFGFLPGVDILLDEALAVPVQLLAAVLAGVLVFPLASRAIGHQWGMWLASGTVAIFLLGAAVGYQHAPDMDLVGYFARAFTFVPLLVLVGFQLGRTRTIERGLAGLGAAALLAGLLIVAGLLSATNHIEAARLVAIGLPTLPAWAPLLRPTRRVPASLIGGLLLLVGTFITGARGPLLAAITALGLIYFFSKARLPVAGVLRLASVGGAIVLLGAAWMQFLGPLPGTGDGPVSEATARQAELLIEGIRIDRSQSGQIRIENLYKPAFESIAEHPFSGAGLPASVPGFDQYVYPHNIVLEAGVAFGAIGAAAALLGVVAVAVAGFRSARHSPALAASTLYFLANSMVSGDVVMNRMLFFVGAAHVGIAASRRPIRLGGAGRRPQERISAQRSPVGLAFEPHHQERGI